MNIKIKFLFQFCTVIFSTIISILETSLLYRSFNLDILGTFFIMQSSTIIISSLFNIRIVESTQVALNKFGLNQSKAKDYFSKLYSFYIITLSPIFPLSFILILFFSNIYKYNFSTIFLSILLIVLTIIFNKLTGFWYAYQFYMNSSQNISKYEIIKKIISIILIYFLFIMNPSKNEVLYISLVYFLKSFIFFIYELETTSKLLNSKIIYALKNPVLILKEFIASNSEISKSIKSSYFRNLFSSIVKNGDIAVAGIITGPSGSSLLKIIKSVPSIILQPSQYINNFAISYINKSSKEYSEIFKSLFLRSINILPIILIISILFFNYSDPFFQIIYKIKLTNLEIFIISILLFLSFFILIFSWSIPLHIFKKTYKIITFNSFLGSSVSILILVSGLIFKNQIYVYFAFIFGTFTTFVLNTASHIYKINKTLN